jgi:predicted TIM-barrel fold metal-dependent hydrolase
VPVENRTADSLSQKTQSCEPIDAHVHIVGNGLRGSGCWLKVGAWHKPLAAFMLRHIGVGVSTSAPEFDEAYATHLAKLVRESSLAAAVILAQDEVYDVSGTRLNFGSFYVPNDYVLKLSREHEEFLPAVSIHPARADALDEMERCLAGGAVMLKVLPNCHNIDCSEPRYKKFWERMAAAGLPLLAHTGGEHTVPVFNKAFSNPSVLRFPLECGVTVIAAHCATKSGLTDQEYFHDFCAMLSRYPNLYGDTSAFNVPIRGRHISACLREPAASRLLHGSDYPVPVFGHWAWAQRFVDWKNFRRCERLKNVLEKDYQLKGAMGFTPEHFTRIYSLLRPTPAVERLAYKKTGPGSQGMTDQVRGISN